MVAANLVEPGENALVLNSGYFGDSFAGNSPSPAPNELQFADEAPQNVSSATAPRSIKSKHLLEISPQWLRSRRL